MEGSLQAREYLIEMGSEMDDISNGWALTDDQFFLLYFIMGTYFGPDLKGEIHKSVFQRRAEGLSPYTVDKLAGSSIKTIEVERVYYYALRKADQSVILKLHWLKQFFHGNLPTSTLCPSRSLPQFDDLFPPHLHPHSMLKGQYEVIKNIVFINDPDILSIRPEYIERFKRLTGLEDLCLEREDAKFHTSVEGKVLYNINVQELGFDGECSPRSPCSSQEIRPSAHLSKLKDSPCPKSVPSFVTPTINNMPQSGTPPKFTDATHFPVEVKESPGEMLGSESDRIFLPYRPTREQWIDILVATKNGSSLTGTAAISQIGPVLGRVDIGECDDSYLFRVSLPGVKRDEREFSCEVESDGKVSIRGVTVTGEKTVSRYEQMFEMQSQNLCPPGHFAISFKLPGPVDPQQFSGNFGTDGILEGIVMK